MRRRPQSIRSDLADVTAMDLNDILAGASDGLAESMHSALQIAERPAGTVVGFRPPPDILLGNESGTGCE